jgi:hypothetical protein
MPITGKFMGLGATFWRQAKLPHMRIQCVALIPVHASRQAMILRLFRPPLRHRLQIA